MAATISKRTVLASAVAGLLSVGGGSAALAGAHESGDDKVSCYGVNKCKGTGACGGKHADGTPYSCHGNNACKGQGFLKIDKETCLKIQGGRLTAEAPKG